MNCLNRKMRNIKADIERQEYKKALAAMTPEERAEHDRRGQEVMHYFVSMMSAKDLVDQPVYSAMHIL